MPKVFAPMAISQSPCRIRSPGGLPSRLPHHLTCGFASGCSRCINGASLSPSPQRHNRTGPVSLTAQLPLRHSPCLRSNPVVFVEGPAVAPALVASFGTNWCQTGSWMLLGTRAQVQDFCTSSPCSSEHPTFTRQRIAPGIRVLQNTNRWLYNHG